MGQINHKISLFADNIILFLSDLTGSPSKLQMLLGTYSSISGYKVNMDKSEILPLTRFDYSICERTGPFIWLPQGFKCLGITVDNDLRNVFNLTVLVQKVVDDLNRWIDLPLTLFGRIS